MIKSNPAEIFVKFLFWTVFFALALVNIIYLFQPVLESYGFRQTQTALTTYYFQKNGFMLSYETPVVGEGWSIPFEFPIYQYIVSLIAKNLDLSIEKLTALGRLINLIFILACCKPIYSFLDRCDLDRTEIYFALAMFLSCPIYFFWSGTFMIEGLSLFFTCYYCFFALRIMQREYTNSNFIWLAIYLLLAMLQKITTILPVYIVTFACIASTINYSIITRRVIIKMTAALIIPVLIAFAWVVYTDIIKSHNPIGIKMTSSALTAWNYGTLKQRVSNDLWVGTIFGRIIKPASLGGIGVLFVFLALLQNIQRQRKLLITFSIVLFFLPFLMFPNLHIVHTYYQVANALFYIIAVSVSIVWVSKVIFKNYVSMQIFIMLVFVCSNLYFFYKDYYPVKSQVFLSSDRTLALASHIRSVTPIDRPVIWYGLDWSSELAFYSERRSLTVPNWGVELDVIIHTEKYLSSKPSAIVLCPSDYNDSLKEVIEKKYKTVISENVSGCSVYLL